VKSVESFCFSLTSSCLTCSATFYDFRDPDKSDVPACELPSALVLLVWRIGELPCDVFIGSSCSLPELDDSLAPRYSSAGPRVCSGKRYLINMSIDKQGILLKIDSFSKKYRSSSLVNGSLKVSLEFTMSFAVTKLLPTKSNAVNAALGIL